MLCGCHSRKFQVDRQLELVCGLNKRAEDRQSSAVPAVCRAGCSEARGTSVKKLSSEEKSK